MASVKPCAWVALARRLVTPISPPILNHAISAVPVLASRHNPRPKPIALPIYIHSRGIARMRGRSPPVPREDESSSESDEEKEEEFDPVVDDGEESEWEGFVLDFGGESKEDEIAGGEESR